VEVRLGKRRACELRIANGGSIVNVSLNRLGLCPERGWSWEHKNLMVRSEEGGESLMEKF